MFGVHSFSTMLQVHSTDFPGTYDGYDDAWDFEKFKKVKIHLKFLLLFHQFDFNLERVHEKCKKARKQGFI